MSATRSDLLIALNGCALLSRPILCKLACSLDRWRDASHGRASADLARELGIAPLALDEALRLRGRAERLAHEERARASALSARLITLADPDYPPSLFDLPLPPPVLAISGRLPAAPAVTVVGSRRTELYGLEVARSFARQLAEAGAVVVSGLAQGIDTAAHRGALEAATGTTVAVLGCGLGVDYPRGQKRLAHSIAERGAVISEFPVGTPPARWQFPVRNRILAALSQTTVIVRAAPRSGSLVTARFALELGRDIFAVPGRIFEEGSLGPNTLIRDGAFLLQHPSEILERLEPPLSVRPAMPKIEDDDVLAVLPAAEHRTAEELARALGWTVDRILARLLELELEGRIQHHPGGGYYRPV